MTKYNQNNPGYIPENITKPTYTIAYYNPETEQNTEITHEQLTKITNPQEFQVVNQNENYQSVKANLDEKVYGPCSYSGCYYDTPFWLEIFIEGNSRKWARRPNTATFLPGSWEWAPLTSNYLYRDDLWLNNIDQGRRVLPLLSNDDVYSRNLWGKHTSEDVKFCNAARDVIWDAIKFHEKGGEVRINETFESDDYRLKVQVAKIGATVATAFVNPVTAVAVGGVALGSGMIGQAACDSERGKRFWGNIGGVGLNAIEILI